MFSKNKFFTIILFCLCLAELHAASRDTLNASIEEIEKIFLANNLRLLSARYGVDEAKALIKQSKLWDNPSLYLEQNIYNSTNGSYFDVSKSGENIIQFQQLITIAGKRNKKIKMAETNAKWNEYQFYDLLRTLKYELRQTFFDLYYTMEIIKMYDGEMTALRKNVAVFDTLNTKGIISLKESVRLKAFLFSLENERLAVSQSIIEKQQHLLTLLNDTATRYIHPLVPQLNFPAVAGLTIPSVAYLQDSAMMNRYDLKGYKALVNYEQLNLQYQKALTYPDMKLGGVYDRQGNFITNYTAVTLQIDLPMWNRNQGNIQAAKYRVQRVNNDLNGYQQQVSNEIKESYYKGVATIDLYKNFDNNFTSQFNILTDGILRNYQKRNITIVEFIDFFESYKAGMIQVNRLKQGVVNALEEMNYVTGTNLFKY